VLPAPRSPDGRTIRQDRAILAGCSGTGSIMPVTNMLERVNEEIKRRTRVVRIFPNAESCLRLVRALAVEMHENWLEASRYLNMDDLREHNKLQLRRAA
jgi:putative transposase